MVITEVIYRIKSKLKMFYDVFIVPPKVWMPPQKCDVLIYDMCGSEALAPYLKKYRTEIASVRGESINLYCLLHAIFKANFWKGKPLKAYVEAYIKFSAPRLCITFIDNNANFYTISDSLRGVKTMLLQNGLRDDWLEAHTDKSLYKVDFMLVFNKFIGSIYERHINGKIVLAGSLKNNFIEKTHKTIVDTVLFISTYTTKPDGNEPLLVYHNGQQVTWVDFCESECIALKHLKEWCNNNDKKLGVAGCVLGDTESENRFYADKLNGSNWEYFARLDIYSTYKLIDSAEIVVTIDSTMGYEAIARGKKTAFFSCRGLTLNREDRKFGWPADLPNNDPFWTNDQSEAQFQRVMDYLNTVSVEDWEITRQRYATELMEFDPGNTRFVALLDQLLPKTQTQPYAK